VKVAEGGRRETEIDSTETSLRNRSFAIALSFPRAARSITGFAVIGTNTKTAITAMKLYSQRRFIEFKKVIRYTQSVTRVQRRIGGNSRLHAVPLLVDKAARAGVTLA
jgi:hypothetical protein